jgi:DNA mismatch endonuclease, patch repair protein
MDIYSKHDRSALMASVRTKDTRPELAVRTFLHSRGLRYRLNDNFLTGPNHVAVNLRVTKTFTFGKEIGGQNGNAGGARGGGRDGAWYESALQRHI